MEQASAPQGGPKRYERGSEEFSRALALSDGVFAIAMTLLVVGIALPSISDEGNVGDLLDALSDLSPSVISFFISFAVIARYWAAHQDQFSMLPISIVAYAINVAIVSGMEVILFRKAYRDGLLTERLPEDVYRWGVMASFSPVLFFVLSIPVAFLSTTAAVIVWFLGVPFRFLVVNRRKPAAADEYLR
jgi:Endosomal/lysosomal potassium channel TMEM175